MRHFTNVYYKCSVKFLFCAFKISGRSRGGAQDGPPPPLIFRPNLDLKGPKKFGGDQASPVMLPSCLRVWLTAPRPHPFILRSGSGTEDGLLFRIIHIKVGLLVRDSE